MKVIMIGSDRTIFKEGSPARLRMADYAGLFDELHIIVFNKGFGHQKTEIAKNAWIHPTNSFYKRLYPKDGAKKAVQIIKEKPGDWLISTQDPFEAGLAGRKAAKKTGAKLHVQIHTDLYSPYFWRQSILNIIRLMIARRVLPKADGIRVVSERIADSLKKKMPAVASKIEVLPIFVDPEKFQENGETFDFSKTNPKLKFLVIMAGRLEKEKNYFLAIKVLEKVIKKFRHVGLAIIGEGRLATCLKLYAKSKKLENHVVFLPRQENLAPFFRGASAFLQTSNYEGFGMSMIEAGYIGLPIVTTDVGAVGSILQNEKNALVCPVKDADCLAKALVRLVEDNYLKERLESNLHASLAKFLPTDKSQYLTNLKKHLEKALAGNTAENKKVEINLK